MRKILIIDDDEVQLKALQVALRHEQFEVVVAKDGREGLRVAFAAQPDLIILDVMLPEMNGLKVCRRLRELCDVPIIMLTALSAEPDIVRGLEAGADDYMTKPFGISELIARMRNIERRKKSPNTSMKAAVLVSGPLTIDLARHHVMVDGRSVDLTPTEFRLLSYLAHNSGRVIRHSTLLTEVWGPEYSEEIDYLHLYVRYLRKKIEVDPAKPEIIRTERGVGYYLEAA